MIGTVKWFNNAEGYGFTEWNDDLDVFLHCSAILDDPPALAPPCSKAIFVNVLGQRRLKRLREIMDR
jgi:'Cold-shock' DNA-binding domain